MPFIVLVQVVRINMTKRREDGEVRRNITYRAEGIERIMICKIKKNRVFFFFLGNRQKG